MILECCELTVRYQACWIIVTHAHSVRVQHVRHAKFWVLFTINDPHKRAILITLVKSGLHFSYKPWVFHQTCSRCRTFYLMVLDFVSTIGPDNSSTRSYTRQSSLSFLGLVGHRLGLTGLWLAWTSFCHWGRLVLFDKVRVGGTG